MCSVARRMPRRMPSRFEARARLVPPLVAPSIEAVPRGHPAAVLPSAHRLWGLASEAGRLWEVVVGVGGGGRCGRWWKASCERDNGGAEEVCEGVRVCRVCRRWWEVQKKCGRCDAPEGIAFT